jgi:glyoxylase-like metal-dependent hydrolase (beta-lactamase superfamily II)
MPAKQIGPGLFEVSLGVVNMFLLESDDGLTLVDTGYPNSTDRILAAVTEMGKQPADIRHIIITHAHPDHIGSLAPLKRATGARTYIHPLDAPIARSGTGFRPMAPAPGLLTRLLFRLFMRTPPILEPTTIDHEIADGEVLPIAGGLKAIHTPGHCAGHLAFLWPRGRALLAGDACANMPSLGWSIGYEDIQVGRRSLERLAELDFESASFGHGRTIQQDAAERFRKRWRAPVPA